MLSNHYIWFIIALCVAGGEMVIGTFYLLAVAIGIMAGGIMTLLGATVSSSLIVTAVVALLIFMALKRIKKPQLVSKDFAQSLDIGQIVTVLHWVDEKHGRIQYRGTQWDAELIDDISDAASTLYEITGQRGNIFLIRRKK